MKLVNVRKTDDLDEKFTYAVKFNNDDKKVIRHFSDFADLLARLRSKKFDEKNRRVACHEKRLRVFFELGRQNF